MAENVSKNLQVVRASPEIDLSQVGDLGRGATPIIIPSRSARADGTVFGLLKEQRFAKLRKLTRVSS